MSASWKHNQYSRRLCGEIPKAEPAHHGILNPGPLVREADTLPLHHCLPMQAIGMCFQTNCFDLVKTNFTSRTNKRDFGSSRICSQCRLNKVFFTLSLHLGSPKRSL